MKPTQKFDSMCNQETEVKIQNCEFSLIEMEILIGKKSIVSPK
jgi:hypothetical protein